MKTITLFTLLAWLTLTARSQSGLSSAINVSGNTFSLSNYSIDWSVGELALVHTATSTDGFFVITNGLLQPELPRANNQYHFSNEEIRILPNLTSNIVEINILTRQQGTVKINVYDATGKKLAIAKTTSNGISSIERINLSNYAAGTYFLKIDLEPIMGSVPKTGSYKIVKL
jgi:hypothetical protein